MPSGLVGEGGVLHNSRVVTYKMMKEHSILVLRYLNVKGLKEKIAK